MSPQTAEILSAVVVHALADGAGTLDEVITWHVRRLGLPACVRGDMFSVAFGRVVDVLAELGVVDRDGQQLSLTPVGWNLAA